VFGVTTVERSEEGEFIKKNKIFVVLLEIMYRRRNEKGMKVLIIIL